MSSTSTEKGDVLTTLNRDEKAVTFVPLGEQNTITLTVGMVDKFIEAKTKRGESASFEDKVKFLALCKARRLNPWTGDAFLIGYDSKDGPTFSLITAYQALAIRAEQHPEYDGKESGLIVERNGELCEIDSGIVPSSSKLVGAWCRVYRKDRSHTETVRLPLEAYDQHRAMWNTNKAFMIEKCAKAAALREAFPSTIGGLYTAEETQAPPVTITAGEATSPAAAGVGQVQRLLQQRADITQPSVSHESTDQESPPAMQPHNAATQLCSECGNAEIPLGGPSVCSECAAKLESQFALKQQSA